MKTFLFLALVISVCAYTYSRNQAVPSAPDSEVARVPVVTAPVAPPASVATPPVAKDDLGSLAQPTDDNHHGMEELDKK